jgi:hypothetical protein
MVLFVHAYRDKVVLMLAGQGAKGRLSRLVLIALSQKGTS